MAHFGHAEQALLAAVARRDARTASVGSAEDDDDAAARRLARFRQHRSLQALEQSPPPAPGRHVSPPAARSPRALSPAGRRVAAARAGSRANAHTPDTNASRHAGGDPPASHRSVAFAPGAAGAAPHSSPHPARADGTGASPTRQSRRVRGVSGRLPSRRVSILSGTEGVDRAVLKQVREAVMAYNRSQRLHHDIRRVPDSVAELARDVSFLRRVAGMLLVDAGAPRDRIVALRKKGRDALVREMRSVVAAELALMSAISRRPAGDTSMTAAVAGGGGSDASLEDAAEAVAAPPPAAVAAPPPASAPPAITGSLPAAAGGGTSRGTPSPSASSLHVLLVESDSPPPAAAAAAAAGPTVNTPVITSRVPVPLALASASGSFADMVQSLSQSAHDAIDERAAGHPPVLAPPPRVLSPTATARPHLPASPSPGPPPPHGVAAGAASPPQPPPVAPPTTPPTSPPSRPAAAPTESSPAAAPVTPASEPSAGAVLPAAAAGPRRLALDLMVSGSSGGDSGAPSRTWLQRFLQAEANAGLRSGATGGASEPARVVVRLRSGAAGSRGSGGDGGGSDGRPRRDSVRVTTGRHTAVEVAGTRYRVDACVDGREAGRGTQADVFAAVGVPLLRDVWRGYATTLLTVGGPASGKSYTAHGGTFADAALAHDGGVGVGAGGPAEGIVPRLCRRLFQLVSHSNAAAAARTGRSGSGGGSSGTGGSGVVPAAPAAGQCVVQLSLGEVADGELRDLLLAGTPRVPITDAMPDAGLPHGAACLSRHTTASITEAMQLLRDGNRLRAVCAARHGFDPRRTHTVFVLRLVRPAPLRGGGGGASPSTAASRLVGTLVVVDTGHDAHGNDVPSGWPALRSAVAAPSSVHASAPFSGATALLGVVRESLGGSSRLSVVVTASASARDAVATGAALAFGGACRGVVNTPRPHRIHVKAALAAAQADMPHADVGATAGHALCGDMSQAAVAAAAARARLEALQELGLSPRARVERTVAAARGRAAAFGRLGLAVAHEAASPPTPSPYVAAVASGGTKLQAPHLVNLSMDVRVCGVLWVPLVLGATHVGSAVAADTDVPGHRASVLRVAGLGVAPHHATIVHTVSADAASTASGSSSRSRGTGGGRGAPPPSSDAAGRRRRRQHSVVLQPGGGVVAVNGRRVQHAAELRHGDRVVFGHSNNVFLYRNPRWARRGAAAGNALGTTPPPPRGFMWPTVALAAVARREVAFGADAALGVLGDAGASAASQPGVEEDTVSASLLAREATELCDALRRPLAFDVQVQVASAHLRDVVLTAATTADALHVFVRGAVPRAAGGDAGAGAGRVLFTVPHGVFVGIVGSMRTAYHRHMDHVAAASTGADTAPRPPAAADGVRRVVRCLLAHLPADDHAAVTALLPPSPVSSPSSGRGGGGGDGALVLSPAVAAASGSGVAGGGGGAARLVAGDQLWDPEEPQPTGRLGDAAKVQVLAQENARLLRLLQAEAQLRAEAEAKAKHAQAAAYLSGKRPGPYDMPVPPFLRGIAGMSSSPAAVSVVPDAGDGGDGDSGDVAVDETLTVGGGAGVTEGLRTEMTDFAELLYNDLEVIATAYVRGFEPVPAVVTSPTGLALDNGAD